MKYQIIGDKEIDKVLRELDTKITRSAIISACRAGAKPLVKEAKQILLSQPESTNTDGTSKLAFVARHTKAVASKSKKNPGVNILIKGPDVPVGNRSWDLFAYGVLLGEGSYKTPNRRTKSGAFRGKFEGFGDWIHEASERLGNMPYRIIQKELKSKIEQTLKRAIKRVSK